PQLRHDGTEHVEQNPRHHAGGARSARMAGVNMSKTPLRVGLVGYGFMGRTHSNAFAKVNQVFDVPYQPVLQAVCARDAAKAAAFAEQWGYGTIETDWRTLVERPDIDLIDIASPNDTHAEIAIAAAGAGKMVLCEKPLGRGPGESE